MRGAGQKQAQQAPRCPRLFVPRKANAQTSHDEKTEDRWKRDSKDTEETRPRSARRFCFTDALMLMLHAICTEGLILSDAGSLERVHPLKERLSHFLLEERDLLHDIQDVCWYAEWNKYACICACVCISGSGDCAWRCSSTLRVTLRTRAFHRKQGGSMQSERGVEGAAGQARRRPAQGEAERAHLAPN